MSLSLANIVRLFYMFVHFGLYVAAFTQAMVQINSIVIMIMGILSAVALVIYIPMAFYYTARKRYTIWDRAYGEVAYILIQNIIWLILSVLSTLTLRSWACGRMSRGRFFFSAWTDGQQSQEWCDSVRTFSSISWTHTGILFGWAIWEIIVICRSRWNADKAWTSSMTALLEGDCGCHGSASRRDSEKALVVASQPETASMSAV